MPKDTLTVTDNRTGEVYELPISHGTIRAMDLRQIKVGPDDFGMMSYDPAYKNTASTTSRITFIDGDKGVLRYRGAIDDDPGGNRDNAERYLERAIAAVKAGQTPDPASTRPRGVRIQ